LVQLAGASNIFVGTTRADRWRASILMEDTVRQSLKGETLSCIRFRARYLAVWMEVTCRYRMQLPVLHDVLSPLHPIPITTQ